SHVTNVARRTQKKTILTKTCFTLLKNVLKGLLTLAKNAANVLPAAGFELGGLGLKVKRRPQKAAPFSAKSAERPSQTLSPFEITWRHMEVCCDSMSVTYN
ncbi:hypothetical protein PFISCL1PPCAC_12450, partial [Pristionchus fissidentatus]